MKTVKDIDDYIAKYPVETKKILEKFRERIHGLVPEATEAIVYGVPTFRLNGNLVHFGAYEKFVSFYPGSSPIEVFAKELDSFKTTKGTIQFPLDQEIPWDLVERIVKFRVQENTKKKE